MTCNTTGQQHADQRDQGDQRDPAQDSDRQDGPQRDGSDGGGGDGNNGADGDGQDNPRTRHGRKLAEWVSLGVSLVVLLSAAGFLVYEGVQSPGKAMPIVATVLPDSSAVAEDRYVVPIEVKNEGPETARDLTVKIAHRSRDGEWQEQDFLIDYLAEYSSQTIYVFLDRPPHEAEIFAEPQQYRLQ